MWGQRSSAQDAMARAHQHVEVAAAQRRIAPAEDRRRQERHNGAPDVPGGERGGNGPTAGTVSMDIKEAYGPARRAPGGFERGFGRASAAPLRFSA